ncbi:MAG TPA: type I glyceraldehyde-3-phosphate dehydrogenase [Candidatus Nanoarchaeia archaeon]|nr:type I glyceraldehyde-3-phosphate dehydrogenase [Candidatus Nanoarchaeia archaeon]
MINVAINGFGRIGRLVLRAGIKDKNINWVAVNDVTDSKTLAHLFKYDSAHGKYDGTVDFTPDSLIIDGKTIKVITVLEPAKLPWREMKIDVVVESTGRFTDRDGASQHLVAGAKKVLISAPAKNPDLTIVMGVNEKNYDKNKHNIISNASCTTNCLAPIVKILNDNFKVKRGFMTTIHAYTADQKLVDAPHKDLRRARNAAASIIPTSTGAAKAVAEVIPELKGKLDGLSFRVPIPTGSVTDFVCELEKNVTKEELNEVFKKAADKLKGVLYYTKDPIVSVDIVTDPHSSIFDSDLTYVIEGNFVKVVSWYDNEWGFSNRMIDVIKLIGK